MPSLIPALYWQEADWYTLYSGILFKHKIKSEVWTTSFFHALLWLQFSLLWKDRVSHWLKQRKHKYPFFTPEKHMLLERDREIYTQPRDLWLAYVTWVPAHPETVFYVTLQHNDSSTLWWAVRLVKHIFSSLFGLLPLTHTHGSHNELFRVVKTDWSYYCLALNFWGKNPCLAYGKKNFGAFLAFGVLRCFLITWYGGVGGLLYCEAE